MEVRYLEDMNSTNTAAAARFASLQSMMNKVIPAAAKLVAARIGAGGRAFGTEDMAKLYEVCMGRFGRPCTDEEYAAFARAVADAPVPMAVGAESN